MKLKLLISIALAVAFAAGWWWFPRQTHPAANPPTTIPKQVKPETVSQSRLRPANAPKMTIITDKPARDLTLSHGAGNWLLAQKIVNTRATYAERLKAIRSLSSPLNDTDWEVLQSFLLKPDGLDKVQMGQVVKNVLLDVLCALNPPPAGLGGVLAQMYRDQQQDEVIRDYAVQHLAACYEQLTLEPDGAGTQQAVGNVLWEAVNESNDSIGGTALLALKRLSQEYPEFDQQQLAATALQMAGDDTAGELTHITAFQVCASLGTTNALPVVLNAAQSGETVPVRISAIAALGILGGASQIPFLNSLIQGNNDRLKLPAQQALNQINAHSQP